MAMENAFLYEELAEKERMKHELAIARRIQLASLPQKTPVVKGLEIAGSSLPALEVGGDFFDYLNGSTDHLTVVVGDVSGKGTSAALYMSKVQGILRSLHPREPSPVR
jgi:serine phosphatase RsbU (regulator of sigma subunit)